MSEAPLCACGCGPSKRKNGRGRWQQYATKACAFEAMRQKQRDWLDVRSEDRHKDMLAILRMVWDHKLSVRDAEFRLDLYRHRDYQMGHAKGRRLGEKKAAA